ncbi:MAG TPA: 50S ribosomal protein L30 [Candidatus Polarisedimenticolia bacterium]|nr:50S ribosomal protein L30 [Candidatus Polarisedimenticolia bacterium]
MPETATKTPKKKAARKPARASRAAASKTITIEQYRSGIGCNFTHKRVLKALGFRKIRQRVVRTDNAAVRGMVETIPHLLRIVES